MKVNLVGRTSIFFLSITGQEVSASSYVSKGSVVS